MFSKNRAEREKEGMKNQESSGDFNDHHEAQKRKWPYSESDPLYNNGGNYSDKSVVVAAAAAAKKCMTSYSAYENFQLNQQYIISECPSNGQEQAVESSDTTTMTTTIAAIEATATSSVVASATAPTTVATTTTISNCNQSSIQMLNTMELGENIEYVNILYEDDLLTSIQAPVATESHYINFEPNWGNADILDLDQRNYYYEVNNANTINLSNLNGQMSHHNEQEAAIQIQHHQSQIGQNEIQQQCLEVAEQRVNNNHINNHNNNLNNLNNSTNNINNSSSTSTNNNNDIHNVTEYEVIQNTAYPEAENGREKSTSNLRKLQYCFFFS